MTVENPILKNLDIAVIGNCAYAALIDKTATVSWMCLPRVDGDPVFCSLLEPGGAAADQGYFAIELADYSHSEQRYLHNSAILVTTLYDLQGSAVEVTDFAPRFYQDDRIFRPLKLVRHLRPVAGHPRVRIIVRPTCDYGARIPKTTRGTNYIRYVMQDTVLRLTTDGRTSFIAEEKPFLLNQELTLMFGPDEPAEGPIAAIGRIYFERTRNYWREWTRYLSIPFEWQKEVIRAAVTLKLCSVEETGAIVAAITTSLPEFEGSSRNWDYRFCWLRDAYFVVRVLNRLGATRTLEDYSYYISNLLASLSNGVLQPVYGVMGESELTERQIDTLAGYRAMGPVRVGNDAFRQTQNDSYGAVIMALSHIFFDQRLENPGNVALFERLERLGEKAVEVFDQPDAGLWELRNSSSVHTFSAVMCWAAADNLARIAAILDLGSRLDYWRQHADAMKMRINNQAFNAELGSYVASFGGDNLDASLLLLHELGFVAADDPRFIGTVEAIGKTLRHGDHLFRYVGEDDFGKPVNAFTICTFWYIDALADIGRTAEARELFENMLTHLNPLGLLSEDIAIETGELWGNFPQTYSMVGLINSAMKLSHDWNAAF